MRVTEIEREARDRRLAELVRRELEIARRDPTIRAEHAACDPVRKNEIRSMRFGVKAVQLLNEGHFGSMVSYQNYQVRHVPIADAVNRLRLVPPNGEMVQTARDVEISFGD